MAKKCTYCGAEYGDEAVVCPVDEKPLIQCIEPVVKERERGPEPSIIGRRCTCGGFMKGSPRSTSAELLMLPFYNSFTCRSCLRKVRIPVRLIPTIGLGLALAFFYFQEIAKGPSRYSTMVLLFFLLLFLVAWDRWRRYPELKYGLANPKRNEGSGPPPLPPLTATATLSDGRSIASPPPPDQNLFEQLVRLCANDDSAAERLVQLELKRHGAIDRHEAVRLAIEQWNRDNHII